MMLNDSSKAVIQGEVTDKSNATRSANLASSSSVPMAGTPFDLLFNTNCSYMFSNSSECLNSSNS